MLTRRRFFCSAVLLVLSSFGFYLWLGTGPLRRSVIGAISRQYQGHIDIDRVAFRIGGGLVLKGLRLRETSDPDSPVICEISRIELHGSLWGVCRDQFHPAAIIIRKPVFRLRREQDGPWVLNFPFRSSVEGTGLPRVPVQITDAQLEFVCADSKDLQARRLGGIQLTIERQEGATGIQFVGQIEDPIWASWQLSGTFYPESGQVRCHVRSSLLLLQPQQAEWLGIRYTSLWEALQPTGQLNVEAVIALDLNTKGELEYQLLLDPQNVCLQIPTIPEKARDITGRVEVTPQSVRVHGLVGRLATGEILASGTISREMAPHFNLMIDVRRVPLREIAGHRLKGASQLVRSLTGKLQIEGVSDPQTWTGSFEGSVLLARASGSEQIPLHLSIAEGLLELSDLQFTWAGGKVKVFARAPIHEGAIAEGSVALEAIDLNAICELSGEQISEVEGTVGGELAFQVPVRDWSDGLAWGWSGPLRLEHARFGKVLFESLAGNLTCRERRLALEEATGSLSGRTLRGNVRLDLADLFVLVAAFRIEPLDLAKLGTRPPGADATPPLRGQLHATGSLNGTLKPLALELGGIAYVQRLGIRGCEIGDTSARYVLTSDGFDFHGAELQAFAGKIRLNGRWGWKSERSSTSDKDVPSGVPGYNHSDHLFLEGDYERVDIASFLAKLCSMAPSIRGRAKGTFQIDCPLNFTEGGFAPRFSGGFESARLHVGPLTVENAKANAHFVDGVLSVPDWSAMLEGEKISGSARIDQMTTAPRVTAQVNATTLNLAKIISTSGSSQTAILSRGSASGQLAVQWEPATGSVQGQGSVRLSSIVLDGLPAIDCISTSKLELRDRRITLRGVQATLWGGAAQGTATIDLSERADRLVDVVLERVDRIDLTRLASDWPISGSQPRGRLSGAGKFHVPGNMPDQVIFGSGEFNLESGLIFGLPVTTAAGTVDAWDASTHEIVAGRLQPRPGKPPPQSGDPRVLIRIREARAARGNVQGAVVFGLNRPISYDANLQFSGLDLATVAQSAFATRYPVTGSLSGEMQLHGTERGAGDVTGELRRLRVDNGNLWHVPVIAVIIKESSQVLNRVFNRDLPVGSQTAEASRVTLANGTLHFDEFRLFGEAGKLLGQGTVALDGQVDLEVVGNFDTGLTKNVPILNTIQNLARRAQQRLVKFHIIGTMADPIAVPVPLQDLTEPAEKFLRGILTGTLFDDPDRPRPMRR